MAEYEGGTLYDRAKIYFARMFKKIVRLVQMRHEMVEKVSHRPLTHLAIGTEGFGLIGNRAPLVEKNLKALRQMEDIVEFAKWAVDNNIDDIKGFITILNTTESTFVARSHRSDSIPIDVVRALGEIGMPREEEEEEGEEIG